jgi:ribosomal protein S18 acetylase RimI-like enzyme
MSYCFVAVDSAGTVAGYYTFSATGLPMTDLRTDEAKRLPRYPLVPAGLIGRLSVDKQYQGQGLGPALILDAVDRAMRLDLAIHVLVVEAKDEKAKSSYAYHGFRPLSSRPLSLS